jgi:hypothetical protein
MNSARLRYTVWLVAILLGSAQAWVNRYYMGNDGVPYLDMADAYLRGEWHTALNGYWNPLYSWLIAAAFFVFRPSAHWEFAVIQLLNFAIYLLAAAAFDFFIHESIARIRNRGPEIHDCDWLYIIAWALFLWTSLDLIGIWTVNADMLVAASIYATLGLIVRSRRRVTGFACSSLTLALVLAGGYSAKL